MTVYPEILSCIEEVQMNFGGFNCKKMTYVAGENDSALSFGASLRRKNV